MNLSRLTIRARITGGSLIIAILISIIAGVVIFTQVQHIVSDGQQAVLDNVEGPYLTALTEAGIEEVDPPGPGQLVAVVNPGGKVNVDTLPAELSARLSTLISSPDDTTPVLAGGATYLVRATAVQSATGTWQVVSAIRTDFESGVLNQVAILLVASIAGINIAFGAASWFIGTAALRPVDRLRRSAASLVTSRGDELLPSGPAHDEISDLAGTLNELIRQLRASAERERAIVSDASHEFRTPIAIMQTQLELAQAEASSLEQMQTDVAAAQRTLARLSTLATSMLELSRIDVQVSPGHSTAAELQTELADAADRGRSRVGGRDIRIDYSPGQLDVQRYVTVDAADFGRVCDNLVNNALAAIDEDGVIVIDLDFDDDRCTLTVSDAAGGMDAAFVPHAFDRFSRADSARGGSGAGLGLSIVAGIASVAGGSVRLDNRVGVGLAVAVTFPTNR